LRETADKVATSITAIHLWSGIEGKDTQRSHIYSDVISKNKKEGKKRRNVKVKHTEYRNVESGVK
jgi:hypothetical protein